jgi:hypothetical protein
MSNIKIKDSVWNGRNMPMINDSSYKAPYGAVVDWLKLNKLNITPEEFRKNSQYQEAYKNWANRLQSNRNLENKKQQMYYSE